MIKTVIIALSGVVVAAASPAIAGTTRDAVAPVAVEASSAAQVRVPEAKPVSAKTRYCFNGLITGSRIAHKTCQTRDQWLLDGVDPLAKN